MIDLYAEFRAIVAALETEGIPYAVCGGMAMAAYGHARATQDVDLLVAASSIDAAVAALSRLGYTESSRLALDSGRVRIVRAVKIAAGDHLVVDLLEAPDAGAEAWQNRQRIETEAGPVWFVSRQGLIAMKRRSGRLQDLADIEKLEGNPS